MIIFSLVNGGCPVFQNEVVESCNIASIDIQCKVVDASDLQSGGGTAGAARWGIYARKAI